MVLDQLKICTFFCTFTVWFVCFTNVPAVFEDKEKCGLFALSSERNLCVMVDYPVTNKRLFLVTFFTYLLLKYLPRQNHHHQNVKYFYSSKVLFLLYHEGNAVSSWILNIPKFYLEYI